jgi:hypothetical protein
MPALPPAASVVKIAMKCTSGSDLDMVNRVFMQYSGTAPTVAQLNTFAAAVAAAWASELSAAYTTEKTLVAVTVEDLTSSTAAVGAWAGANAGVLGGGDLPLGVCVMLNFAIARRYRGGKPRSYFSWGSQADLSGDQTWLGSALTAFLGYYNTFITQVKAAPWAGATITDQVNVSYYEGFTNFTGPTGRDRARSTPRAGAAVVDAITAVSANPRYASQRRRNRP